MASMNRRKAHFEHDVRENERFNLIEAPRYSPDVEEPYRTKEF
jgi:hypothetical protein